MQVLQAEALVRHLPHRHLPPPSTSPSASQPQLRGRRGAGSKRGPPFSRAISQPPITRALRKAIHQSRVASLWRPSLAFSSTNVAEKRVRTGSFRQSPRATACLPARPLSVTNLGGSSPIGQPANQEGDSIPPLLSLAEAGIGRNFGEPVAPRISGTRGSLNEVAGSRCLIEFFTLMVASVSAMGLHFLRGGEGNSGIGLGVIAGCWSSLARRPLTQKSRRAAGCGAGRWLVLPPEAVLPSDFWSSVNSTH